MPHDFLPPSSPRDDEPTMSKEDIGAGKWQREWTHKPEKEPRVFKEDEMPHDPPPDEPTVHKLELVAGGQLAACVPAQVSTAVVDPVMNPYTLGTLITVSALGVFGTAPIRYFWYLNGTLTATTSTFTHTLSDSDVQNKDPSGLGVTFIYVVVRNACGEDQTDPNATIPVQGDPPP